MARVSRMGLPLSSDSKSASFSALASMMSATLFRMMARSALSVLPQVSNAFHAASTARSTSSLVASAMVDSCSPLAGQNTSSVPPSEASTHWPSM